MKKYHRLEYEYWYRYMKTYAFITSCSILCSLIVYSLEGFKLENKEEFYVTDMYLKSNVNGCLSMSVGSIIN